MIRSRAAATAGGRPEAVPPVDDDLSDPQHPGAIWRTFVGAVAEPEELDETAFIAVLDGIIRGGLFAAALLFIGRRPAGHLVYPRSAQLDALEHGLECAADITLFPKLGEALLQIRPRVQDAESGELVAEQRLGALIAQLKAEPSPADCFETQLTAGDWGLALCQVQEAPEVLELPANRWSAALMQGLPLTLHGGLPARQALLHFATYVVGQARLDVDTEVGALLSLVVIDGVYTFSPTADLEAIRDWLGVLGSCSAGHHRHAPRAVLAAAWLSTLVATRWPEDHLATLETVVSALPAANRVRQRLAKELPPAPEPEPEPEQTAEPSATPQSAAEAQPGAEGTADGAASATGADGADGADPPETGLVGDFDLEGDGEIRDAAEPHARRSSKPRNPLHWLRKKPLPWLQRTARRLTAGSRDRWAAPETPQRLPTDTATHAPAPDVDSADTPLLDMAPAATPRTEPLSTDATRTEPTARTRAPTVEVAAPLPLTERMLQHMLDPTECALPQISLDEGIEHIRAHHWGAIAHGLPRVVPHTDEGKVTLLRLFAVISALSGSSRRWAWLECGDALLGGPERQRGPRIVPAGDCVGCGEEAEFRFIAADCRRNDADVSFCNSCFQRGVLDEGSGGPRPELQCPCQCEGAITQADLRVAGATPSDVRQAAGVQLQRWVSALEGWENCRTASCVGGAVRTEDGLADCFLCARPIHPDRDDLTPNRAQHLLDSLGPWSRGARRKTWQEWLGRTPPAAEFEYEALREAYPALLAGLPTRKGPACNHLQQRIRDPEQDRVVISHWYWIHGVFVENLGQRPNGLRHLAAAEASGAQAFLPEMSPIIARRLGGHSVETSAGVETPLYDAGGRLDTAAYFAAARHYLAETGAPDELLRAIDDYAGPADAGRDYRIPRAHRWRFIEFEAFVVQRTFHRRGELIERWRSEA